MIAATSSPRRRRAVVRRRPRVERLEDRLVPSTLPANFAEVAVASGLTNPTAMAIAPDGRLWALEQAGQVEVFHAGSPAGSTALTIPAATIDARGERGLLGIAFDPGYRIGSVVNDYVYLYYTSTDGTTSHNRIVRFTVDNTDPDRPILNNETDLVDLDPLLSYATNHNGGAIHFGPDGKLYVGVGENGNGPNAQSLTTRLGKILRYNPDGSIPLDNPTSFPGIAGTTAGVDRSIWAVGLRNPYTFAFDPTTGHMNINDVGQNLFEEIDVGKAGANYGWPLTEGTFVQSNYPAYTEPIYTYSHGEGTTQGHAITGGAFDDPTAAPSDPFPAADRGDYFFADVVNGWINVIDPATGAVNRFASNISLPVDLHFDAAGGLDYLSRGSGTIMRVAYTPSPAPSIIRQPTDQTLTPNAPATFTVAVDGSAPIAYQWQRANAGSTAFTAIPGANGPSYTLPAAQATDEGAQFRVLISNASGSLTSSAATLSATANQGPSASITLDSGPINGKFIAGRPILFSAHAVDPRDGVLGASSFTFQVDYLTAINSGPPVVRLFVPTFTGLASAGFTPATSGPYGLTDVIYRITLVATDSAGLSATSIVDIAPNVVPITLATDPTGLAVVADGQTFTSPATFPSVVGYDHAIGVLTSQQVGTRTDRFTSWSDGGAAIHQISTPDSAATYTAAYTPTAATPGDLDGDGKADLSVYLPSIGAFAYRPSSGGADVFVPFGIPGAGQTIPALGDYDGDGKADIAAYLPFGGVYAYRPSSGGPDVVMSFGIPGAGQSLPTPGDFDGTGRDEPALYLPSVGAFAIRPASGPDRIVPFGIAGAGQSLPAVGDYFGTGRDDIAVYLPAIGSFAIRPTDGGADAIIPFGVAGLDQSIPAPGDYDGDGKTDLAVYMPNIGVFAYRPSSGGPDVIEAFGRAGSGSIPVPGDYTGSGKSDVAIFDPTTATFAIRPPGGADLIEPFGPAGVGASLPASASAGAPQPVAIPVSAQARSLSAATVARAAPVSGRSALVRVATLAVGAAEEGGINGP